MISDVHRPESPQTASAIRVLALLALTWALVAPTAGVAEADACAYASVGPDGRGGWTVEAAESICEEPGAQGHLALLQDCSLILAEESAEGIKKMA